MLRVLGVAAVSCVFVGCTDTSSLVTTTAVPTLLSIDPLSFMGPVRCGPPELQSYVVSITDVTNPSSPTLTAVSAPTACPNPTSFGYTPVIPNHFYTAEIDGYDRPVCDSPHQVFPPGCVEPSAAGSRSLIDHATSAPAPPRYHWQCGEPSPQVGVSSDASTVTAPTDRLRAPTQVLFSTEVFVQGCEPVTETPSEPDGGTDGGPDAATDADSTDDALGDVSQQLPDAAAGD